MSFIIESQTQVTQGSSNEVSQTVLLHLLVSAGHDHPRAGMREQVTSITSKREGVGRSGEWWLVLVKCSAVVEDISHVYSYYSSKHLHIVVFS